MRWGRRRRIFEEMGGEWLDEYRVPVLPWKANGLVLLRHIRQHMRGGLGLRQMIDWMMYVERELLYLPGIGNKTIEGTYNYYVSDKNSGACNPD